MNRTKQRAKHRAYKIEWSCFLLFRLPALGVPSDVVALPSEGPKIDGKRSGVKPYFKMQEVDLEKFLGAIVSTQVRTDHLHKTYITLKF